ncbi:hydroxymethylpyrimidine/phosphomethylpyrimidine kinase [Massilia sp. RP-1-19]|uniref:hydroxymethylpyrimidine kinase n=1 Tax=Massilia polaris TaxID=2728846 RepID=A0A848HQR3_9BURK|nr:hydroxymethylpyrimidine/phosphomethylpyrimidine kinase [Massilia polaris]
MTRPAVLVFSGLDPSGGAGVAADVQAIAAQGAHALPVVTALTVQDHNWVYDVEPVDACLLTRQARVLAAACRIKAIKVGIPGNRANAEAIASFILRLREDHPALPMVLDPVLASGNGDPLSRGGALAAIGPLLALATVVVPNLAEAQALAGARFPHLLVTGGHASGPSVRNRWHGEGQCRDWEWPRLAGGFHGSGCTLSAAIAGRLALGEPVVQALERAQAYCHGALASSFALGAGQRIPDRSAHPV